MKKTLKRLLPFLILVVAVSSCKTLGLNKKPTAKIEKFDIESISLRDITFAFHIGITNPYPIGLKLDDIRLKFSVENKQLMKTAIKGFKIRSRGKEVSKFTVNLKYTDIINIVRDYARKEHLNCVVDMEIVIPLPKAFSALKKNISFKYQLRKKIPAIKPSIRIANFKVQKPSLEEIANAMKKSGKNLVNKDKVFGMFNDIISGRKPKKIINPADLDVKMKVSFDIVMENKTKAKLMFKDLQYDFVVNSSNLVAGKTTDIKNVGKKSVLRINNEFSSKALGKAILNAFTKKRGSFGLKGQALVKFPDAVKKEPLILKFNEKGRLSIQ
ncbi:MAG: LEA type 2 family protein [bacterium]|nr:LEA type 2 family protein [bacterium]